MSEQAMKPLPGILEHPPSRADLWTRIRIGVVLLLLAATGAAVRQTYRLIAAHQQSRFDYEVMRIDSAVAQRMTAYVQVLRGGLGLFGVTGEVSREDWRRYVDALQLAELYPGFKSLSYAAAVKAEDLPVFVARVRAEPIASGLAESSLLNHYTLRSPGANTDAPALHAPILYVAPSSPENARVLGVDMMQEPMRRDAMERAADSGQAVLSPLLRLAGEIDHKAGFIAYLAVRRDGTLRGWLTAAFRAEDFMRGLLGNARPTVDFEIYDGTDGAQASLLYSTAGIASDGQPRALPAAPREAYMHQSRLELPGRSWLLRYVSTSDFILATDRLTPWLVALGGLLATLLFYAVSEAASRLRAALDKLADQNRRLQREIEVRERVEAEVRHRATHDLLTGLPNRTLFMDRMETALERARRRGEPFALLYIDIDGFKAVNDTYGHHVGDALLRALAERMRTHLRREDTLARLGGDEFALILEEAIKPPEAAARVGNSLIRCLAEPFVCARGSESVRLHIGASVGIALYPTHGADCDTLIVSADSAMYRAKRGGKNRCVISDPPRPDSGTALRWSEKA